MQEDNNQPTASNVFVETPLIYRSNTQPEQVDVVAAKKKKGAVNELIKMLIVIVVVALIVFGILLAVKEAGGYDSVGALLEVMFEELIYIWERIFKK